MFLDDHYILEAIVKLPSPFAEFEADASLARTKRVKFTTTEHSAYDAKHAMDNARTCTLVSQVKCYRIVPVEVTEYDLEEQIRKESKVLIA